MPHPLTQVAFKSNFHGLCGGSFPAPVTAAKVTMLFPSWASGSQQAPDSCVLAWKSQSPPAALTVTPATARVNAGYMVLFSEQEEFSAYHFIKYNILCLLMFWNVPTIYWLFFFFFL